MQKIRVSGQHLTEFVLCLAVVSATILMMQVYGQRSLQARYKSGADYVLHEIEREAAKQGKGNLQDLKTQYDPYYTESDTLESHEGDSTGGFPYTSVNQTLRRTGWQKVNAPGNAD